MSESLWPHGLEHARLPCLSPSPGICSDSCPLSQLCHPTFSSSVAPFSSCPQSFAASVFSNESALLIKKILKKIKRQAGEDCPWRQGEHGNRKSMQFGVRPSLESRLVDQAECPLGQGMTPLSLYFLADKNGHSNHPTCRTLIYSDVFGNREVQSDGLSGRAEKVEGGFREDQFLVVVSSWSASQSGQAHLTHQRQLWTPVWSCLGLTPMLLRG